MRAFIKFGIAGVVFGYFVACSPVKFQAAPAGGDGVVNVKANDVCPRVCQGNSCVLKCSTEKTVGEGLVDILIVDDNSGSMSTEQSKMADRFSTFIQSLGSLNYRIAITTTDISSNFSSTPANAVNPVRNNGVLQDGNLIQFSNGTKFIDRNTSNIESVFANAIKRQETLDCEQSGFKNCPSGDERGIFAANLVLERTASEFARPTAHFAVIFLSDEDERGLSDSRSDQNDGDPILRQMYPLENKDLPETFVSNFAARFPDKTMSAHSIIVKPGDTTCRDAQTGQGGNAWVRGVEGYSYAKLSDLTGGQVGTICADDYGSQLQDIGYHLQNQVSSMPFQCQPINNQFNIVFTPQPAQAIDVEADFNRMVLEIKGQVPPLTRISLTYDCVAN